MEIEFVARDYHSAKGKSTMIAEGVVSFDSKDGDPELLHGAALRGITIWRSDGTGSLSVSLPASYSRGGKRYPLLNAAPWWTDEYNDPLTPFKQEVMDHYLAWEEKQKELKQERKAAEGGGTTDIGTEGEDEPHGGVDS